MTEEQIDQLIEDHERNVAEAMKQINQAKYKLESGDIITPAIRELYGRTIALHESHVKMLIDNHNLILSLYGR